MKSIRFYKILVLILIVLNLSTVYFLYSGAKHHGPPDKNELINLLQLTGTKKITIVALQDQHFKKKHQLMQKSRNLHEELFQSFNKTDTNTAHAIINNIVENQREIEQMTFDYFQEVNSLCTPSQQVKLQKLLHEVLKRAGGPHPPRK
ncbi:MAG: hypothetical protein V4638_10230 [Bacteroidota bacterium]